MFRIEKKIIPKRKLFTTLSKKSFGLKICIKKICIFQVKKMCKWKKLAEIIFKKNGS